MSVVVLPPVNIGLPHALDTNLPVVNVALPASKQLSVVLEQLQQYPEQATVICAHPNTPAILCLASILRWPHAQRLLQEGEGADASWRNAVTQEQYTVISVDLQSTPSPADRSTPEALASTVDTDVVIAPKQPAVLINTRYSKDSTSYLLKQLFLHTVWGAEQYRAVLDELMQEVAQRHAVDATLLDQAQKQCHLAQHAYQIEQEMSQRLKQGDTPEFRLWLDAQLKNADPQVAKHLQLQLDKRLNWQSKHEQKIIAAHRIIEIQTPDLREGYHPNSIRHLTEHDRWDILIDETGTNFDAPTQSNMQDRALGRLVALAIPVGKVSLPPLKNGFHAADEDPQLVDQAISHLLQHPVGVLGLTIKDQLIEQSPQWFSAIHRLIRVVLRLLPLSTHQPNQVQVLIEQRGDFNKKVNLYAIEQLMLSELKSLDPQRFAKLKLKIGFTHKNDHPANGYVDALAYTWGCADQKRLKRTSYLGHCFLRPSDQAIERLYAAIDSQQALSPEAWYGVVSQIGLEPESSVLHPLLKQLGQHVSQQPTQWQAYLEEVQARLNRKLYQPDELSAAIEWLTTYQPAEQRLPDRLKLQWVAAQLAAANHQGQFDLRLLEQAIQLGQQLTDEVAPEVCQAHLRVAVAATNAFEFDTAREVVQHWAAQPIAVQGRHNYVKVLSSLGQHAAFLHQHTQAEHYFEQALAQARLLTDPITQAREMAQTRTYRLINQLEHAQIDVAQLESDIQEHFGRSFSSVIDRLAITTDDRFAHHLLLRVLVHPSLPAAYREQYLQYQQDWLVADGHPWPLIQAWRGWLLWQTQQPKRAQAFWQDAVDACFESDSGSTLQWIGAMWAQVAMQLGVPVLTQALIDQHVTRLSEHLPHLPTTAWQQLKQQQQPDSLYAMLAQSFPFNFR